MDDSQWFISLYGLDYVQMAIQRLIGFWEKAEFKEILNFTQESRILIG